MRALASLVTAALLVVGLPAVAHAQRWTGGDPVGDVTGWHHDPAPGPCGTDSDLDASAHGNEDLVRFSVQHTRKDLRFVAHFREFDKALEQGLSIHIQTPRRAWQLDVDRHRWTTSTGEMWQVTAELSKPFPEPPDDQVSECGTWMGVVHRRSCKIARTVDLGASTITAAMPRSCIGYPAWVRVGVRATGWDFPDNWNTGGHSIYSDQWGDHAPGESDWHPPLGPEVQAPPVLRTARRRTAPG